MLFSLSQIFENNFSDYGIEFPISCVKMYSPYLQPKYPPIFKMFFSRYQINARTELARKYKNVSPLENHHAAMAFEILSRPECNIFSGMTSKETEAVHNVIYFNTFSSTYTLHIVCSSSNARST